MSLSAAASRVYREGSGRCGFTRSRCRRGHCLGRTDADGAPPFLGRADPGSAPPSPETWGIQAVPLRRWCTCPERCCQPSLYGGAIGHPISLRRFPRCDAGERHPVLPSTVRASNVSPVPGRPSGRRACTPSPLRIFAPSEL
jgi:hypothetical protein